MNYIVFDLEWNQCPEGKRFERPDLPFEIVEIGAIKLNSKKAEISRFHEYIRPCVYTRLHFRTKEIIHINNQVLQEADSFPVVYERFRTWCGEDAAFCTWGSLDLLELQRNIRFHKLTSFLPFPLKFYDIQKIFSLALEDGKSRRTLEYAVDLLGIEKDIAFHEAFSDAYYTARVMRCLPGDVLSSYYSIDYFRIPQKKSEEFTCTFPTYTKYVSRKYASKSALMKDKTVLSRNCCLCGKSTDLKINWFQSASKSYLSLSHCPRHGWMKGKIRIKKAEDKSGYFCVKTLKLIDAERAYEILEKYLERKDNTMK